MNPFEQHGIAHLSASSLNAFRSSQAYWIVSYLAKIKDPGNIAMFAGQAAEDAVSHGLFNPTASIEECIDLAAKAYRHKTALGGYPFPSDTQELGYIAVHEDHRGENLSEEIIAKLISTWDKPLFATTASDSIKDALRKMGFEQKGKAWEGQSDQLTLWIKSIE